MPSPQPLSPVSVLSVSLLSLSVADSSSAPSSAAGVTQAGARRGVGDLLVVVHLDAVELAARRDERPAGRAEIEMHPVNLNPCVDRVLDALALRVEETGARIEREKIPMVLGDEALLTQVLQNLVANGLKFVRPGESPHLRIYARQDGGFVSVAVEDHGIGVPAEHRDAIFEPFRRLHGRAEYEGTGIGLAICRKIAEKHGGGVWIEETEGGGASFFVSVPAAPGSSA